jgi:uncharacterized membrane protein YgdD (TMEM256/DUF423 family)
MGVAAMNGLLAVAAGAFGAHGLEKHVTPELLDTFEVGARYHMYHALAIGLAAAVMPPRPGGRLVAAAWAFLIGLIIFSGSLYALVLSGVKWLGAITPIGGVSLMVGWALLAAGAMKNPRDAARV